MLASISEGTTRIKNLLMADDCLRAIEAFRAMGVFLLNVSPRQGKTSSKGMDLIVHGVGMRGLKRPAKSLYLGNSGTTMRILPGILAGQDFEALLKGDKSLSKRPMWRIIKPLREMGVEIAGSTSEAPDSKKEVCPPLKIRGGKVKAINYTSKIASAQVKTCILLAGLFADGITSVSEPVKSRDHTERMLEMFGCRVKGERRRVGLKGPVKLKSPGAIDIPNDLSSAAFFIAAGCILPDRKIIIRNIGLNPTRTGILDILKRMGADIRVKGEGCRGEPRGDIVVKSSKLRGVTVSPEEVVKAIDEIPILMVAACLAKGETVIRGVGELRVKETDRIKSMVGNLCKMGADIRVKGDRILINGGRTLHGARVSSYGDHRTAMSMLVAGLVSRTKQTVTSLGCINKSFPGFENLLHKLKRVGEV